MATIVTRAGKGSPLTNTEVDANFENLNAEVTPLRHSIRPSLLLDFANSKTLDPRIDFTRSSTATYYDGKTFAKAEENLFTYSQEFGSWSINTGTITANTTTAPDGTTTAETLTEIPAETNSPRLSVSNGSSFTNGQTYTSSCFLKAGTSDYGFLSIRTSNGNIAGAVFDLSTGTVDSTADFGTATYVDSGIEDVGNSWYRCWVTVEAGESTTSGYAFIGITDGTALNSAGYSSYTLTGATIYLWGAQLEQRDSVTAYTPTTTQPITNYIPVLQTAAAGTARFDHDPVTGESKGLLIEEQRTNLFTYSEDFSDSSWTKLYGTQTGNTVIAIDGSLSGSTFTCTSSGIGVGLRRDLVSYTAGNFYTASFYVKYVDAQYVAIDLPDAATSTNDNAVFDILNGTVVKDGNTSNGGYASIIDVGNGWYRISITGYAQSTLATGFVALYFNSSSSSYNPGYSGVGKSFKVWGAQVEAGAFHTSYIKTTSAQATRNADAASMTGTNFSSWYRQDEGTVYGEVKTAGTGLIVIDDNSVNNRIVIAARNTSGSFSYINKNNATEASFSDSSSGGFDTDNNKIIMAYKFNNVAASLNGVAVLTDTSASIPTVNNFKIGASAAGIYGSSTIKKIAYYPTRLTNAELQALTEE